MATTYSIDIVGGTATDVAVKRQTIANWSLIGTTVDKEKRNASSTWVNTLSDPDNRATLTVNVSIDNAGVKHAVWSFRSVVREQVDGVETRQKPITLSFAAHIPFGEAADVMDMILNLFSFTFDTVTSKVPDSANISKVLFGISDILG